MFGWFRSPQPEMGLKYKPQEDITAYEMALIYGEIVVWPPGPTYRCLNKGLLAIYNSKETWDTWPDKFKRHFEIVEDNRIAKSI